MLKPALPVVAVFLLLGLTACDPTWSGGGSVSSPSNQTEESDAGEDAGGDPVSSGKYATAPGMPELPLTACGEPTDFSESETDSDIQWMFVYECSDDSAFNESNTALATGLTQSQNDVLGDDISFGNISHFYGKVPDGRELQVNLKLTGLRDEPTLTYLVTLITNPA